MDRQRAACRKIAKDRGWPVVEEYVDNSTSAYAKNVRRPAYDRLVKDYTAGRFEAIVVWDLDRLTRQPRQLEDWIDAAEERGLTIVTADGATDLGTESGRQFARIKAAIARGEVEHKSKRQRLANDQRAERGLPFAGRRPFGYETGGARINRAEAREYRHMVDALLDGASLRAIVRGLADRGVTTTAGNPWKPTELRRLLVNPRHAGLRVHRGEVVGKGTWPALIDEDTHRAVVAVLSDPSRRQRGRPRAYLLSGIARCGLCGARIYGRQESRGALYVCEDAAHMGPKVEPIDSYVNAVMVERLSRPDAVAALSPTVDAGRVTELRADERRLRTRLDGLSEAFALGDIDRQQLTAGTKRLRDELERVSADLTRLLSSSAVAPMLATDDAAAAWEGLDTAHRRSIINLLAQVTLHPPGRGARVFRPETVQIDWRFAK